MTAKKKPYRYSLSQAEMKLELQDSSLALEYGSLPADKRLQVKMPSRIVEQLDALFPNMDRSKLLTKLAIEAITQKLRFNGNPTLGTLQKDEQDNLDRMWEYLEERNHA